MNAKILYTKSCIPFILESIGKKVSTQGYVLNDDGSFFIQEGKRVKADKIIAFFRGRIITNFCDIIELEEKRKNFLKKKKNA